MAEELTFKQGFYNSRAVTHSKAVVRDGAEPAQCGCHQFLAGPARTCNQRRTIVRGYPPDLGEHLKHKRTSSDHAFKLVGLEKLCIELQRRLPLLRLRYEFCNSVPQHVQVYRLGDWVALARPACPTGRV